MPNGMRWVGLDVHAHASTPAVFDDATGEVITRRVVGRPMEVLDVLRELPGPLRAVYEAGPTGYGLVRRARAEGIEMAVCSPGNIERRPGDRIKTDKRDAIRLARLFAAGDLRFVWVPTEAQEQLRDLVRCREDLRADLMRARHRLATFLLRRERYFPGPGSAGRSSIATGSPQRARPLGVRIGGQLFLRRRRGVRPARVVRPSPGSRIAGQDPHAAKPPIDLETYVSSLPEAAQEPVRAFCDDIEAVGGELQSMACDSHARPITVATRPNPRSVAGTSSRCRMSTSCSAASRHGTPSTRRSPPGRRSRITT